ncbi:efflux RND transporter permease subunit [Bacteroidales bacterium OttesenSCG-928-B11]|nr:efflux RND transporter permease subunit [Bacteroidales bacterium OttesenSCG-928-E04]MDL2309351.1 efflux RND transporter permease subunit [Bacteroidales bacterium OttesenSCG-928-C03]MDL2312334.1 efflux RND transporter permease subunit [Bacteroidales bacterium OttesenSCG-928-B11]MDL2326281.1 efflux RND transporter permease subunit [Bacteroidales bacterium OttesenSCG-928-A14]
MKELNKWSLSSWSLDNRKLIYFLAVVLVLGGILSYYDMSKLEDPEIIVKQAMIVTTYPGASAHQVELEVTDLLEKNIRTMKDVEDVESRSMNDVSIISVGLKTTVQNDEVEQSWDMLRRKVNDVQHSLPEGATTSIVLDNFGDVYGIFYAMTYEGFTNKEAVRYAELIQRKMQEIDGVSQVSIYGEQKECIHIELYEDQMANLGVHPAEVISTVKGQNQTIYAGYFESGDMRIRVAVSDKYKTVDDIGDLLLQGHENDQLRLRDIARVTIGNEEPVRNELRYDQQQAIGISISALSGTDITKIGRAVNELLEELNETRLPEGIEIHEVFFQPDRVNIALNTFVINLLESILIVVVLLMFTMGFRSGVIIGTSLLITVLGSLLVLNMLDGTLQRVSLAAFVLAMGMLVDNAIVIVDGIQIDLQRGVPRRQALTSIGQKTSMPLLGATLIAILAFLPIFLSPDTAGIYVRDLFIVLAVSLMLSWILALTLVPIQSDRMLKIKEENSGKDPYGNKAYRALRKVLNWALSHRITSLGIGVALILVSLFCFRFLPRGFFPDMDYDQLYIEYKLAEGINSTRVRSDLETIEDYLLAREDVTHVTTSIGGTPSRYNLVRNVADPSISYGELIVDYTSSDDLVASIDEIQQYLTENYPQAYVRLKRYNLMYKKFGVEVEFSGPDPAVLRELTAQALEAMNQSPDLFLPTTDWEPPTPVLTVDYNQPIARSIGLSRQDVGLSLLAATGGIPMGTFYDATKQQTIYIKCVDKNGNPIESLENTPVFGMLPSLNGLNKETLQGLMTGAISEEELLSSFFQTIPLSQATNGVRLAWEEPVVIRRNGQRVMRAQCNPMPGISTETARQSIDTQIENITLPEGYTMSWQGEKSASAQSVKYLFKNYPLAIILMIAILIMLFKDYKKPLIIFLCIPLMFVGVIFGLLLSGKEFAFVAIVATLGLMGMIIKNGIVLMDEIDLQISSGKEPITALLDSVSSRFRPVMMASLTTILGMIPLLPDPLFGPGAVAIMGGLLIGTLITLLFIPVLYALFFKIKKTTSS